MDSAAHALRCMGLNVLNVFASDTLVCARSLLTQHVDPQSLFSDVTSRTLDEEQYVDIYVFGPPCQTFSAAGKGSGVKDRL